MSLTDYKLTDAAIASGGVVNAPDKLTGTATQNKMLFDRLIRETVKSLFNGVIDELSGAGGAAEIGLSAITGLSGSNVQAVLESLKTTADEKLDKTGGTMTGAIAMSGHKITGLAAPTSDTDAATKQYADANVDEDIEAHNTSSGAHANLYIRAGKKSGSNLGAKATAEGEDNTASGDYSHAEGTGTTAFGDYAHAEGYQTKAIDNASHAEGNLTEARGAASHAEGNRTYALGTNAHAEGLGTKASRRSQHVFGEYNIEESGNGSIKGDYVEIVGNGTSSVPSNARTLKWNGDETLAGKLTLGAAPTANMDAATKKYVDDAVSGGGGSCLPLSGGTMSGAIAMGSNKITGLAAPTADTDAATKKYADDAVAAAIGAAIGGSY